MRTIEIFFHLFIMVSNWSWPSTCSMSMRCSSLLIFTKAKISPCSHLGWLGFLTYTSTLDLEFWMIICILPILNFFLGGSNVFSLGCVWFAKRKSCMIILSTWKISRKISLNLYWHKLCKISSTYMHKNWTCLCDMQREIQVWFFFLGI
jgi:hypothetical protein